VDEQWKQFFDEAYFRLYSGNPSQEQTAQEVEAIKNILKLSSGASILDLACGFGRHSILLARNYRVTGLDRSLPLLHQAQIEARKQEAQVHWVQGNMEHLDFQGDFDAILCLYSSFGYQTDEDEDVQALQQVQQALKPGGSFLWELVSLPRIVRTFTPSSVIRYSNGLVALEERHIDLFTSRNNTHLTILDPKGTRREYTLSQRMYTLTELLHMLARAGLSMQACYGNLHGDEVSLESRLVIVSQK